METWADDGCIHSYARVYTSDKNRRGSAKKGDFWWGLQSKPNQHGPSFVFPFFCTFYFSFFFNPEFVYLYVYVYQMATSLCVSSPLLAFHQLATRHIFPLCPPMKLNRSHPPLHITKKLPSTPFLQSLIYSCFFIERPFFISVDTPSYIVFSLFISVGCSASFITRCVLASGIPSSWKKKNATRAESCRVVQPPANIRIHSTKQRE